MKEKDIYIRGPGAGVPSTLFLPRPQGISPTSVLVSSRLDFFFLSVDICRTAPGDPARMHASVYMSLSIYPIVCSIFAIPVVPCQLCGKVSLERYRKCAFSALRLLSRARTSSLVFEYRTFWKLWLRTTCQCTFTFPCAEKHNSEVRLVIAREDF